MSKRNNYFNVTIISDIDVYILAEEVKLYLQKKYNLVHVETAEDSDVNMDTE